MCSYQQINNSYACQNSKALNGILKGELGFQGFVMSDWQAQHAGVASAVAGMDMSMPGDTQFNTGLSFWGTNLSTCSLASLASVISHSGKLFPSNVPPYFRSSSK